MIIAFSGKPRTGKTYMANSLAALYHCPVFSFADTIREHVHKKYDISMDTLRTQEGKASYVPVYSILKGKSEWLFPVTENQQNFQFFFDDPQYTVTNRTVGSLLQYEGMALRELDPNILINAMEEKLDAYTLTSPFIIDDMRTLDELSWVYSFAGNMTIRMNLPPDYVPREQDSHPLECALDNLNTWNLCCVTPPQEKLSELLHHIMQKYKEI